MISDNEALEAATKIKRYCTDFGCWCKDCVFYKMNGDRKRCCLRDDSPCEWDIRFSKFKLSQKEYELLNSFFHCDFYRVEKVDDESYAYFATLNNDDHCGAPTGLFKWIKKNESFKIADILSNYEIVEEGGD